MSDRREAPEWRVLFDLARPNWRGVVVAANETSKGFVQVVAGERRNFHDAIRLAQRIARLLLDDDRRAGGSDA